MQTINLTTNKKEEIIDITTKVQELIDFEDGFVYMYCPHTTAGLTINENADPDVKTDVVKSLNNIVRELPEFQHMEGNSTAHVKSILTGKFLQIAVENSKLVLGTWDGIMFMEFDGPRNRNVKIKLIEK